MINLKALAIYLPQFHPIPENDNWWGKGFTEWTNVSKAKPLFKGHYQPHVPSELGYYDLRNIETMEEQVKLAKQYGIYGFMFYHYWFNGKRVLNIPIDNFLQRKSIQFPFCVCWANENWTRAWDGQSNEVLLKQEYNLNDDKKHMQFLCENIFKDERYIKINNKPLFIIYRTELIPDIRVTVKLWNQIAKENGFIDGLYLVRVESFINGVDPKSISFDASMEFQPDWHNLPESRKPNLLQKFANFTRISRDICYDHRVFKYNDLVNKSLGKSLPTYKFYRCVTPQWDNTSRRKKNAYIFDKSTPKAFENWIKKIEIQKTTSEENFLFVNAWNEWAEGSHLEPCVKNGRGYLEALKNGIENRE